MNDAVKSVLYGYDELNRLTSISSAPETNRGFESGDLAGWDTQGNIDVLASTNFFPPIPVPEGAFFALLSNGPGDSSAPDNTPYPDADGDGQSDNNQTLLTRTFTSGPGDVCFTWSWLTSEEDQPAEFDDIFYVRVDGAIVLSGSVDKSAFGIPSSQSPFPDVATDGVFYRVVSDGPTSLSRFAGRSAFETFCTPVAEGTHDLEFIVADQGNHIFDSALLIERVLIPTFAVEGDPITFDYDVLSRRTELTQPNGVVTIYEYDAASQLLSLVNQLPGAPDPTSSFGYTYDGVGNRTSMAQERSAIDVVGSLDYEYDELNRLIEATNPLPSDPTQTFDYDPVGNRLLRDGQTTESVFDAANRLLEDEQFCYDYDANGSQTSKTAKVVGECTGDETGYTYDAENQLVRIELPDGSVAQYLYDGLGRRIEKAVDGEITQYVYDNEDILLEFGSSAPEPALTSTPTATPTSTPEPNATPTLTSTPVETSTPTSEPSGTLTPTVSPTDPPTPAPTDTATATPMPSPTPTAEPPTIVLQSRYTHGPGIDEPLIMERDLDDSGTFDESERFFYHRDGLGSIIELSDSEGAVKQAYVYDSFGQIVAAKCGTETFTGIDAARAALGDLSVCVANTYTYTGREFDPESGLYYYRARYYDPELGRFLQEDPARLLDYAYVGSSPVTYVDPLGLVRWKQFGRGVVQTLAGTLGVIGGVAATSTGLGAAVGIPLAATSGFAAGAGIRNIWSSIAEDGFEGFIPSGIGEAAGTYASIVTGNEDFAKWGAIADLGAAFALGRLDPSQASLLANSLAVGGLTDGIIGTLQDIGQTLQESSAPRGASDAC